MLRFAAESLKDTMPFRTATLDESIQAHLAQILGELAIVPSWYDDWMLLGSRSSDEDQLRIFQTIRDSGVLPEEASFFLIAWQIELLAALRAETELHALDLRIQSYEPDVGFGDGQPQRPEAVPPEYTRLMGQYFAARDQIFVETLLQWGEHEIARFFQEDRNAFENLNETGRAYFRKMPEPLWVSQLLLAVKGSTASNEMVSPLGVRLRKDEEGWDIAIFPESVEVIGGPADGAVVSLGFSIDVRQLEAFFDRVDSIRWSARGCFTELPSLIVKGVHEGSEIRLRILDEPPVGEPSGWKLDFNGQPRLRRSEP